jgi:phosphate transport system protein
MARLLRYFEREIENINKLILSLGTMVEENVQNSLRSLTTRDSVLGLSVIDSDTKIDDMEVFIEEECLKILALYQPVANDLRLIIAILKINNDLERIGDLAVNIAERSVFLSTQDRVQIPEDLNLMAKKTMVMLKGSLDAFVKRDSMLAREICLADDDVDEINRKMYAQFGENIRNQPDKLDCFTQLLSASRYLERVADHATNICEDVIYLVEGEIIRHRKEMSPPPKNGEQD